MQAYHCEELLFTLFLVSKAWGTLRHRWFPVIYWHNWLDDPPVLCLDKGGGTIQEYLPYRESPCPSTPQLLLWTDACWCDQSVWTLLSWDHWERPNPLRFIYTSNVSFKGSVKQASFSHQCVWSDDDAMSLLHGFHDLVPLLYWWSVETLLTNLQEWFSQSGGLENRQGSGPV